MINNPFNNFYKKYNEINKLMEEDTNEKSFFSENDSINYDSTSLSNNDLNLDKSFFTDVNYDAQSSHKQYSNEVFIGDVLGVNRGFYEHYGIYMGENKVVHYTSRDSDTSLDGEIMITDFFHFLRDESEFFTIDFNKLQDGMQKATIVDDFFNIFGIDTSQVQGLKYNIFSGQETVERILSRLGEKAYDLTENNCEHVAMWAKTGVSECNQILTKKYRIYHKYPFN